MTITLSVPEISCGHCKETIEGAVSPLGGVHSVRVDLEAKTVHVDGGDRAAIMKAIEAVGYDIGQPPPE